MAASASRATDRGIHQDYIARIRFSNTLPPPPNPPKLLEIPNTGLSSGQYTAPGFASRLAREQPLNIEADAELGMPLDLVGMPGVFDGDESSIQAPLYPPAPHPHDRPLLRPLNSLGKPKTSDSGVSFLRRTEYISALTSKSRFESTTSKSLVAAATAKVKRILISNVDKESPEGILAAVEQSFEIADEYLKNPLTLKHPSKRNVKLLESFPLIPDLEAMPDFGGYVTVKFQTNPVPPSNVYDIRLESGLLRPIELSQERQQAQDLAVEAHKRDPIRNPYPEPDQDYEFFLADDGTTALNYKRKLDVFDPQRDDDGLYTSENTEGRPCFRFKRIRAYETSAVVDLGENRYNEELLIAVSNGKGSQRRAAYYYPVVQRTTIRPQRSKNIDRLRYRQQEDESTMVDFLDIEVREADEDEAMIRQRWADNPYYVPSDHGSAHDDAQAGEDDVGDANAQIHRGNDTDDDDLGSDN